MADTKLTALGAATAIDPTDLLYLVADVAGTPTSKKIAAAVVIASPPFLQWTALGGNAPVSNPATFNTRNTTPVLEFDTTTQEATVFVGVLSSGYAGRGITVSIHWAAATATSGTVGWDVAIERVGAGSQDLDSDGFATAQTITATTVPGTSGFIAITSVDISNGANMDSLAAGEFFRLRVRRDVTNDTATGDAQLVAVTVEEQ